MAEIQWFFPNELEEVPEILSREGVIPHSGGTGILRGGLTRVRGLMDTSRLGLTFVRSEDGWISLGAGLSYAQTAAALAAAGHILSRSLGSAATQPLRNRISLGGSISMFPYWSDLMGPLLALEAELGLVGTHSGNRPLSEYLGDSQLRKQTLITSIRVPDASWHGAYYRHTRTPTDRPAFSITVLLKLKARKIAEARIVVIGCTGRFRRFSEIEHALATRSIPADPTAFLDSLVTVPELDIPGRMGFSAEYLNACAQVQLRRTLEAALRTNPGSTARSSPGSESRSSS